MNTALSRSFLGRFAREIVHRDDLKKWEQMGRPVPPPASYKHQVLREYAERFRLSTMVETGTYRGDMDFAMRSVFSRIITLELSKDLHAAAKKRFARMPNIECLQGDSSVLLPAIIANIHEPCLFWLDAHYSAGITARGEIETPVSVELDAVLTHPVKGHVVLIDDARCFDGTHDYPQLVDLQTEVLRKRPDLSFIVKDDIIRILP